MDANTMQVYSMCIIPILLIFIFCYLPMFGIIIAFKDYNYALGIFGSEWVGFDNFKFFVTSNEFVKITWNTLSLNAMFIFADLVAALAIAILLFEVKSKRKTKIFQTILITPHFLSYVIVAYVVYAILNTKSGYLNSILGMQIDWYSKPDAWPAILTTTSVWKTMGMSSVIYYAALMGVDNSLFEAADIDGANKWQKIRYIFIPSLVPIIVIQLILKIGGIFRADFGLFYQVTQNVGTLYSKTDVIDTYIFRALAENGNVSMSSAVGLLQSLVGFVLVIFTNWVVKKIEPDNAMF